MLETINPQDSGEVRLSLNVYNDMRDHIRKLEEDNDALVEERDEICDENKVRQRRQIIRIRELVTNPHALGQEEVIEDKLVNMDDISQELDKKIHDIEEGWKRKCEELKLALDECQRQKINLEHEVYRLKNRTWWQRLWDK